MCVWKKGSFITWQNKLEFQQSEYISLKESGKDSKDMVNPLDERGPDLEVLWQRNGQMNISKSFFELGYKNGSW